MSSAAHLDIGPSQPSRAAVYAMAAEIHALARLAVEFTAPGPNIDVPRALKQFERMRAVLGESPGGGSDA